MNSPHDLQDSVQLQMYVQRYLMSYDTGPAGDLSPSGVAARDGQGSPGHLKWLQTSALRYLN